MSDSLQKLHVVWRIAILGGGWLLTLLLVLKALSIKPTQPAEKVVETPDFPSPSLTKMKDAQEGLHMGFIALDNHARVILSNTIAEGLIDLRETSVGGIMRTIHPENVQFFKNTFQEICQSASGMTTLKIRAFDKIQQLRHLQVALIRWKETPVAAIAILQDTSEQDQSKRELQIAIGALHDLHGVFAGDASNLLDTMRALLSLGKMHFQADFGLVARFADDVSPRLEIMQITSNREHLSRNDIFDPTLSAHPNFPSVLAHAAFAERGENHNTPPVFKTTRQGTFLGAPLYVNQQLYGVLCFASPESRMEGIFTIELELVQFMAHWLGQEIERRRSIDDFEARQHNLMEINNSLETLLRNDLLTGLHNKTALEERLNEEFERARQFTSPLSVIALTPNHAQDICAQSDESTWHRILEALGRIIEKQIRDFDIAARYEESIFVIILPRTNTKTASAIAESLQTEVARHSFPQRLSLTIRAHICELSDEKDSRQLLQDALDHCRDNTIASLP